MRLKNRPYGLLARFYDSVSGYAPKMNRAARTKALGPILRDAESVCDLACGSGETALDLARQGKEVHALDWSPGFCKIVREKARAEGLDVRVKRADMRNFRLPSPVDLVLCEHAALNNLDEHRSLAPTFATVARALRPGGHFLFDVNMPKSFETQVGGTHWMEMPESILVLRSARSKTSISARLDLEWFVRRGKLFEHSRETLMQIGWTDAEIRAALKKAGLQLLRTFDGVDVRPRMPGSVRGTDAYYLARKPVQVDAK